jgi:uncharacterized protein (DUF427 family)
MARTLEERTEDTALRLPSSDRIRVEPMERRVRAMFGWQTIADSTRAVMLLERGHLPVYYFPMDDVRMDLLTATDHHTHCPYKGRASYWTLTAEEKSAENAVWGYLDPLPERADIKGYVAFYWNRMDAWYEEDDEVFVHPRSPYHRVDVLHSSRHVKVVVGGEVVAETRRPRLLFETGLPTRYYIPKLDVRMDLLLSSDTRTRCPYKGEAVYWSVTAGGKAHEDLVWSYPAPIPECPKIENHLCFFNERVDAIVDAGVEVPRPQTQGS